MEIISSVIKFKTMKKLVLFLLTIVCFKSYSQDWENPQIIQKNRERPRATFYSFASQTKAIENNIAKGEYIKCLN